MTSLEKLTQTREQRGLTIAQAEESQVNRVEENFYTVKHNRAMANMRFLWLMEKYIVRAPTILIVM